ncbi:MAG TPA: MSMEG_4193 family putative phosphomutase [Methylomirabilota bacterium]|jgi:probable phosphoglycerate mutase|nr:MSMEG_4193 family putative phosphomutase [Methylomirabilota bacterium]
MPPSRPATTLVLLVRHGVTPTTGRLLPGRRRGLHLSDEGRRQAEALAVRLAALPKIAAIYASPLERARETVAPLAKARGMAVRVEPGLLESDLGTWTGLSLKQAAKRPEWAVVQRHASAFRFPGGESFVEMQARMASTVARLVERHRGATIVVASHADPIKTLVAHALGTPLDLFQRIMIAPASISAIAYRPEGLSILTVNAMDGDLKSLAPR